MSHSGRFFCTLQEGLWSLDFALQILYHLFVCQKLWIEVNHHVKSDVAAAKVRVTNYIKAFCHGLLVDSPTVVGGSTNTGLVANHFLHIASELQSAALLRIWYTEKTTVFCWAN